MNAVDVIDYFSSNLYFATKNDNVYLIDDYHLGDPDYEYGIFAKLSVEDIKSGNFSIDNIPDIYVNDHFNWLLDDDLENTYGVPHEIIKKLSECTFCDLDIELDRNIPGITDNMEDLKDICRIMREDKVEGMTDEEIEKYCNNGDNYTFECIEKYENQFGYDEKDEI